MNEKQETCLGCGVKLQTQDPNGLGYIVKAGQTTCQRCFRLRHYGDTKLFHPEAVNSRQVLEAIEPIEGVILLVMDITDLETGLFKGLRRHLPNRKFILVVTKRDLLPKTVSDQKILNVLSRRVKEEQIEVEFAVLVSMYDEASIENLRSHLRRMKPKTALIACGNANAGKSSLLNALMKDHQALTVSPYPHTTLEINECDFDGLRIFDTPGIQVESSFLDSVELTQVPKLVPQKTFKPTTIQLKGRQCFMIGSFGDVIIDAKEGASVTFYFSEQMPIHRTKAENRETYLDNHPLYGEQKVHQLIFPVNDDKIDLVFKQLGWICISGDVKALVVHTILKEGILLRKAMI